MVVKGIFLLLFHRCQMDQMRDRRNAPALLRGGRAEQSACGDKQDVSKHAALQLAEQLGAEHRRAAAAAGTACMHILCLAVKYQQAAVVLPAQQIIQNAAAHQPQIARHDPVIVLRRRSAVVQEPQNGVRGSRCCCQGLTINNSLEKAQKPHNY